MRLPVRGLLLAALLVSAVVLPGCASRVDVGVDVPPLDPTRPFTQSPDGSTPPDQNGNARPLGATFQVADAPAQAAAFGNVDAPFSFAQRATLLAGAPHFAVDVATTVFPDVTLNDGREGDLILVLNRTLELASAQRIKAHAVAVAAAPGNLTLTFDEYTRGPHTFYSVTVPDGTPRGATREAVSDTFHARATGLELTPPFTARASLAFLVTASTITDLGGVAEVVKGGERPGATVALTATVPSGEVAFEAVRGERYSLAMRNATKPMLLDGREEEARTPTLAVLTGGKGSVSVTADEARVSATGARAMQVYRAGHALLPATLDATATVKEVRVRQGESEMVTFKLAETARTGDAVLTGVNVTGSGAMLVKLPGFKLITERYVEALQQDPLFWVWWAPATPAFVIADVFLSILDAIFGPPKIPQVITAGAGFESKLTVRGDAEPGFYDAEVAFTGSNFERRVIALRIIVEPGAQDA